VSVATAAFERALDELATWEARPADRRPLFGVEWPGGAVPSGAPLPAAPSTGRIARAGEALVAGSATCRGLVDEALAAVERDSERLGAFVQVLAEEAREEADRRDRQLAEGRWQGPLHGIPISVKDVIDVAGAETRCGSDAYCESPARDAWSVARLRARGAIVLGKTATHEFALGVTTPQARNPHDPTRIPGGSSGGSGIAVACGMGLASLGTDTRASTRVPAALCGVVGLKATFGAIATDGVVPLSWTMDHVGILAGAVQDAALMFDAMADRPRPLAAAPGRPPGRLSVGVPGAAFEDAEPDVLSGVQRGLDALGELGLRLAPTEALDATDLRRTNAMGLIVSRSEATAFHRSRHTDRSCLWAETRDQLDAADHLLAMDYIDAQRFRGEFRERMLILLAEHDVLAMPTTLVTAPPVERADEYFLLLSRNAIPWSFIGFPVLSVPCGAPAGLPVGIQLVAGPGQEETLVTVGAALEREMSAA
jgi:aspartyl-tRNA(Asn)/glutamyl-tRNA(Gln) amidotransferase subunit A